MTIILETEIEQTKPLHMALQKIYGLGNFQARKLCKRLGFGYKTKLENLSENTLANLIDAIKNNSDILVSNELNKFLKMSFRDKLQIKTYKSLRRVNGLPVRGQRTKTNGKTSKKLKNNI